VPDEETLPKEKVCNNRALFNDQQKIAYQISGVGNIPLIEFLHEMKQYAAIGMSVFPSPDTIYTRPFYFLKHKSIMQFKAMSPQVHPSSGLSEQSTESKYSIELTPKQAPSGERFDIPLLRLASVDESSVLAKSVASTPLEKKLVRARESRFPFAKLESTDSVTAFSLDPDSQLEAILYNAARQELIGPKHEDAEYKFVLPDETIKGVGESEEGKEEDGGKLVFDHKWISHLFADTDGNHPHSASSPAKINEAFDGNSDVAFKFFPYVCINILLIADAYQGTTHLWTTIYGIAFEWNEWTTQWRKQSDKAITWSRWNKISRGINTNIRETEEEVKVEAEN